MLVSESKYFALAKGVLDRFDRDLESRYQVSGRMPTDAMWLSHCRLCLDVAWAEAGFVPFRFWKPGPVGASRPMDQEIGDFPSEDTK